METKVIILMLIMVMILILTSPESVTAVPRTQTVRFVCDNQFEHNTTLFMPNFVAVMENISAQVRASGFGTAQAGTGPDANFALGHCYSDLSPVDCVLCYAEARTILPQCYPRNGGRIYLDGCFMRAGNYSFFREYTGPGDGHVCGNITRRDPNFHASARRAVGEAISAAENNNGSGRARFGPGRGNDTVFVLANCWRSLQAGDCRACLENARESILGCLPSSFAG